MGEAKIKTYMSSDDLAYIAFGGGGSGHSQKDFGRNGRSQ